MSNLTALQERALLFLHDFQPRRTGEIREAVGKPKGWDAIGFIRRLQGRCINTDNRLQCLPTRRGAERIWQLQPRRPRREAAAIWDVKDDEHPCWILGIREQ